MPTKTIALDLDAYQRLESVRLATGDTYSQAIMRAQWQKPMQTCGALLDALATMSAAEESVIQRLDAAQLADAPPDSSWS